MKILAMLPAKGRDLRLDLFRGVANWGIFLDHIPNNIVNWVTTRNYGFSDAADLFIFISGYTVAFVFARMMLERGFIIGASRLLKRVWQIYVGLPMLVRSWSNDRSSISRHSQSLSACRRDFPDYAVRPAANISA